MSGALRIRLLAEDDLPFAESVRSLAGWNQTSSDWRRFLTLEPDGCFLAEWDGAPVGTATTLVHEPRLAWIGMVLVVPEFRRRGIGRALLVRCLEHLRRREVRCVKLDATPLGRPVYQGLGFRDEWSLTRWEHEAWQPEATRTGECLRPLQTADIEPLEVMDASAFGVSRRRLLGELARDSTAAFISEAASGCPAGFGLLRVGAKAVYVGPVVATGASAGLSIVEALLTQVHGGRIFWDIPDQNTDAAAWAQDHGFKPQRSLTRMYAGENTWPGDPRMQFAIGGPETG